MKTVLIVSLVIGFFLFGSIFASSQQSTPYQSTLSYEDLQPMPQVSPFPTPTLRPLPPTPIPTPIPKPTPSNDYLSRLNECLQNRANDPLNEEIKKDRELLNKIDSSNFQCTSSPAECRAQISRERAVILARFTTNNDLLLLKYDCFSTNFKDNSSSSDLEEATLIKDIDSGDNVIIERRNGEQWLLEAKTWCSWCWREEGSKVYLKFGYSTSKLISEDGDVSEFWTEDEL